MEGYLQNCVTRAAALQMRECVYCTHLASFSPRNRQARFSMAFRLQIKHRKYMNLPQRWEDISGWMSPKFLAQSPLTRHSFVARDGDVCAAAERAYRSSSSLRISTRCPQLVVADEDTEQSACASLSAQPTDVL